MSPRSLRAVAGTAALLVLACGHDLAGPVGSAHEVAGSLQLPAGRGGVRLRFSPAAAIDSVFVGPADGQPGAYLVSLPVEGEVTALTLSAFPAEVRFRVVVAPGSDAEHVTGTVVETATTAGETLPGDAGTRIVWLR